MELIEVQWCSIITDFLSEKELGKDERVGIGVGGSSLAHFSWTLRLQLRSNTNSEISSSSWMKIPKKMFETYAWRARNGSGESEEVDRDFRARTFFSRMLRGADGEGRAIL